MVEDSGYWTDAYGDGDCGTASLPDGPSCRHCGVECDDDECVCVFCAEWLARVMRNADRRREQRCEPQVMALRPEIIFRRMPCQRR